MWTAAAAPEVVEGKLSDADLARHFAAQDARDLLGLFPESPTGGAAWAVVDVGRLHDEDPTTPGDAFHAALDWCERLAKRGLEPILEEAGPMAHFRLWVLLDDAIPAGTLFNALERAVADYANKGLYHAPRILPGDAPEPTPTSRSNDAPVGWARLLGRSPDADHHSRVWDGETWLEGEPAIDAILSHPVASAARLLQSRSVAPADPQASAQAAGVPSAATVDASDDAPRPRGGQARLAGMAIRFDDQQPRSTSAPRSAEAPSPIAAVAPAVAPEVAREVANETKSAVQPDKPEDAATTSITNATAAGATTTASTTRHAALPTDIAQVIAGIAKRTGMRETEVLRRVIGWVGEQDEVVQAVILGQIPPAIQPDVWRLIASRRSA